MILADSMLSKSRNIITIQNPDSWIIYNSETEAVIEVNEEILSLLESLCIPTYYSELELQFLNKKENITAEQFNSSITQLVLAGFVIENEMTTKEEQLIFSDTLNLPSIISLHVTFDCNLKCTYCYNESERSEHSFGERTAIEWRDKLLELQKLGIQRYDITGGEPLLRMDLLPIYKELKENGAQIELITNATLITDKSIARKIAESVSRVTLSLDSFDPDSHDLYRGKRTHSKVVKAMQLLTEVGISWQAKGVLTDKNVSSLSKTKDFVKNFGGSDYAVSIMVGESRDDQTIYQQFFGSVIKDKVASEKIDLYPDRSFDLNRKYGKPCAAGRSECAVDPFGGTYPCRVFLKPELYCGNLFEESIESIWENSKVLKDYRNIDYKKIDKCGECSFLRICLGGCRAIAYSQTNSLYGGLDSFDCAIGKRRNASIIQNHFNAEQEKLKGISNAETC